MNPLNEKIEALGKGLGAAQVGFADLSSLENGLNLGYPGRGLYAAPRAVAGHRGGRRHICD